MRRRRAIIFDDEPSVLELLERVLSKRNYEIMSFKQPVICPVYLNNGDGTCLNERPCSDVIITDHRMPLMTGIELLQKQAQNRCLLPSQNKALITGHLSDGEQRQLAELGCTFLAKPFRLADIAQWLDECEKRMDIETAIGIRRKERRIPVHLDVSFRIDSREQTATGVVTDLSPSGFCLKADHDFAGVQSVRILSTLPHACSIAKIRWAKMTEEGSFMVGFSCG